MLGIIGLKIYIFALEGFIATQHAKKEIQIISYAKKREETRQVPVF